MAVFISYASNDRDAVEVLVRGLDAHGLVTWWDKAELRTSDNWLDRLEQGLSTCSGYLIFVGSRGVDRWVKAELHVALKRHYDSDGEFPIVPLISSAADLSSLPPFLSTFQCLPIGEAITDVQYSEIGTLLRGEDSVDPRTYPDSCPFPGLVAFQSRDRDFFFGREEETAKALHYLGTGADGIHRRWLQIEGASGVGKSSLVRAGLIPAIQCGFAQDADEGAWHVLRPIRPGNDPLWNLAEVLAAECPTWSSGDVRDRLLKSGEDALIGLLRDLRNHLASDDGKTNIVLVIDQMEELITLSDNERPGGSHDDVASSPQSWVDRLLAEALEDRDGPLILVTVIRSDFLIDFDECLPHLHHQLAGELCWRQPVGQLRARALRRAIDWPARRAGLVWQEKSLPDMLAKEVESEDAPLPLLANMLRILWDARKPDDSGRKVVLPATPYHELGGLGGALASSADQVLECLSVPDRERVLRALLELVRIRRDREHTRQPVDRCELLGRMGGEEPGALLAALTSAPGSLPAKRRLPPLLSVDGERVELAHEVLVQRQRYGSNTGRAYWATLYDRIESERQWLEEKQRIKMMAEAHHANPTRPLLSWRELKDLSNREWIPDSEIVRSYLKQSRRRRRSSLIGYSFLILLSIGASLYYLYLNSSQLNIRIGEPYRVWLNGKELNSLSRLKLYFLSPSRRYRIEARAEGYFSYDREFIPATRGNQEFELTPLPIDSPEVVHIEGGRYRMGSGEGVGNQNERPQHWVSISPFYIGKYEVSFNEFDAFAHATGRNMPNHEGWGRDFRPVINVSRDDAQSYVSWLSEQTGESYRLPSESEWEYVARASSNARYWWGDDVGKDKANCKGCGSEWDEKSTAPVGSFEPNGFGLHDTAGNAWEWVADCWHENYEGAPEDGSVWSNEDGGRCSYGILRGGSWFDSATAARSAFRIKFNIDRGNNLIGFRLAKDSP